MAKKYEKIDFGTGDNTPTGDTINAGFKKVNKAFDEIENDIESVESDLIIRVNNVESNLITRINNVDSTLTNAINEVENELITKVDEIENELSTAINDGDTTLNNKIDTVNSTLTTRINNVDATLTNAINDGDTTLNNKIDSVNSTLTTRINNVDSTIDGRIATQIADLVDGAPATFDTFKEIADWIETEGVDVTDLTSAIALKVDKTDFENFKIDNTNVITNNHTSLNNKIDNLINDVNVNIYDKNEVDTLLSQVSSKLTITDDNILQNSDIDVAEFGIRITKNGDAKNLIINDGGQTITAPTISFGSNYPTNEFYKIGYNESLNEFGIFKKDINDVTSHVYLTSNDFDSKFPDLIKITDGTSTNYTTFESIGQTITKNVVNYDYAELIYAKKVEQILAQSANLGIFIKNRNEAFYYPTGANSIDLTISNDSTICGASGARAIAMGYNATAIAPEATAIGFNAKSSSSEATALGYKANAGAISSTSIGNGSNATGNGSTAIGGGRSQGSACVAIGFNATSANGSSSAIGSSAKANGTFSVALGDSSANGSYSLASQTGVAHADYSIAIGAGTVANAHSGVVFGRYNLPIVAKQTTYTTGAPLLIIGNGTSPTVLSNAYVLNNDGTSTQNGVANYGGDYSANFTTNSLVSKKYVDDTFSKISTNFTKVSFKNYSLGARPTADYLFSWDSDLINYSGNFNQIIANAYYNFKFQLDKVATFKIEAYLVASELTFKVGELNGNSTSVVSYNNGASQPLGKFKFEINAYQDSILGHYIVNYDKHDYNYDANGLCVPVVTQIESKVTTFYSYANFNTIRFVVTGVGRDGMTQNDIKPYLISVGRYNFEVK